MREYESCFAPLIRDFIAYRLASGRWNEASYGPNMRVFDRYCKVNYPDAPELIQEMVDSWCAKRESETNNSCRSRIYVVHSFVKYLAERGLSSVQPPEIPRKERSIFIPYVFMEEEIRLFFQACDSLPDIPRTANVRIRRITVPVFFRLLYSSGIRTTEARLLRTADVDMEQGVLNIRYSKGHDQHYIVLHDSMADLMRRYDSAIRKWFPDREYFFPAPGDKPHPHTWVEKNFRRVWSMVSTDRHATAYAFRHHYATSNINRWIGEGFSFEDQLAYLSKSMGHTTLESTRYYYTIVPVLSQVLLKKTEAGFNELVPEVADEDRE